MSRKPVAAAAAEDRASGKRGPGQKDLANKDGDIISVEEKVWTLRMGARDPPCNVARFEEIWVGKGDSKRKVTRPPFDDPGVFSKPAYMYRVQEAEEHSEDEDYEGPEKMDAFDRPAFKRRGPIKERAIQWALEDRKDYSKGVGIKYLGDKVTQQMSRYATFKVDPGRTQTIEVTPIDEWWHFKKAARDEGKIMSVKEAEELMKKQERFIGPLSSANKVLSQKSKEAAAREAAAGRHYGTLDREDAQVLQEAGVKLGAPEDGVGLGSFGGGSDSDDGFGAEKGDIDSDAGGEDDDFGDEVRSDDEEEVGNDDANEGGGTLHQDDEDLNDSDDAHLTDDENHELQKLSRSVNAEGEEEDEYAVNGDPGRASPTLPLVGNSATHPGAAAATVAGGISGESPAGGGVGKRGASAMEDNGAAAAPAGDEAGVGGAKAAGSSSKRARKDKKKGTQEINQANVVATLKRYGGRLASKLLLRHFVAALKADGKANKAALATLREILKKVATKVDDAIEGTVWILKTHYS